MISRHLARIIAIQSLYEWDFNDRKKEMVEGIIEHNVAQFIKDKDIESNETGIEFVVELVTGVIDKQGKIDPIIEGCAPDWPLNQITTVDRNVLRLGIYELMFSDYKETPPRVAINEAIELAKTFGGENSGKFVNGVLGTVYKELGEPMKKDEEESAVKAKKLKKGKNIKLAKKKNAKKLDKKKSKK